MAFGSREDRACEADRWTPPSPRSTRAARSCWPSTSGVDLDLAVAAHGEMPLPPYIAAKRGEDERDRADYQTVYAREDGSVAAPTAGLHFTPDLLERLKAKGVSAALRDPARGRGHLPAGQDRRGRRAQDARRVRRGDRRVADALNAVRAAGGRIVCVGTTSLRLLESATGEDA
jgi:S-adenosylmethionine:tRNA ribosyltransferase-isomerase